MRHTAEPWKTDQFYIVADVPGGRPGGEVIVQCYPTTSRYANRPLNIANARRIVAAVNACEGIPTEALEEGAVKDLLEALTVFVVIRDNGITGPVIDDALADARNAIAKASHLLQEGK